jgi:hypothetical protein
MTLLVSFEQIYYATTTQWHTENENKINKNKIVTIILIMIFLSLLLCFRVPNVIYFSRLSSLHFPFGFL